jgi:hypothetical protein
MLGRPHRKLVRAEIRRSTRQGFDVCSDTSIRRTCEAAPHPASKGRAPKSHLIKSTILLGTTREAAFFPNADAPASWTTTAFMRGNNF